MKYYKHLAILFFFLVSCGVQKPKTIQEIQSSDADLTLKMQHQIMYRNGNDTQVFEGYMIQKKDAYIVKAFAGPGVDLFTIARKAERRKDTLDLKMLANKLDVSKIGDDILRIFMDGCPFSAKTKETTACIVTAQKIIEKRDQEGRLTERRFPDAHTIGLNITYKDYSSFKNIALPAQIELQWGDGTRQMIIRTVSAETSVTNDDNWIEKFLQ